MATTKKKKPVEEGFLNTAAQAIGSTLGTLAKKAGVATPPVAPKAIAKKTAAKKKAAPKKKAAAKKKVAPKKKK